MIRIRVLRSFDESLAGLSEKERSRANAAMRRLMDYFDGGSRPIGLGLRKLREPYWEVRCSLGLRVLFALEKDLATFLIVGNHEDIRRRIA